jgi:hypothetical protein
MKKSPAINSVESKAGFQQKLVEKFVQQNLPAKGNRQNKISGMGSFADRYQEIECCAAETPVIGTVEIFFSPGYFSSVRGISIPVSSRFFVFCARNDNDDYKVAWSSSLT